ncbi:hypothetical protein [Streptomyces sp. NPDC018833]|uniref:hypothetical protein n=1 Tax=Streptomyces sp. NPDC018833 TaxID=3365053 RepID=UPI0037891F9F
MTQLFRFEVDVPIHHSTDQTRRGLHVFTGPATGPNEALAAAHSAYDQAVQRVSASLAVPDDASNGRAVCGVRPDWVLEWHRATVNAWVNHNGLT